MLVRIIPRSRCAGLREACTPDFEVSDILQLSVFRPGPGCRPACGQQVVSPTLHKSLLDYPVCQPGVGVRRAGRDLPPGTAGVSRNRENGTEYTWRGVYRNLY